MFKKFILAAAAVSSLAVAFTLGQQIIGQLRVAAAPGAYTASAQFEVASTSRGAIECPKMTTTQKNAITSPASYLCVSDTALGDKEFWNGAAWVPFVLADSTTVEYNTSNQLRIKAAGVDTAQIKDGAITAAKMAAGVIRSVAGCAWDTTLSAGYSAIGCAITRTGAGAYTVTFSPVFSARPAMSIGYGKNNAGSGLPACKATTGTGTSIAVVCQDNGTGSATDVSIEVTAVGS